MSADPRPAEPFDVLIAGAGVAGLEAALALSDLAGKLVRVRLMAPAEEFVYRPMTVREPFSYPTARRYPLEQIASDLGAQLVRDVLVAVDADAKTVRGQSGETLTYDALLLALGAKIVPRYEHAVTLDDRRLDELLHGLIQDVELGYSKRLAFVVSTPIAWPLPIYELALMTASRAHAAGVQTEITLLTPEDAPLAMFGSGVSDGVSRLLAERGIEVISPAYCEIPRTGHIEISPGDRVLEVDRVVALPHLEGPEVEGVPAGADHFIPVDEHCRVRELTDVYAAGDAVDFPIKYGGLAAQQADAAAQSIAAAAGAEVQVDPFRPEIHGVLLAGDKPRYFSAEVTGGHGESSELSDQPSWSPPTKIAARYLAPYLERRDPAAAQY